MTLAIALLVLAQAIFDCSHAMQISKFQVSKATKGLDELAKTFRNRPTTPATTITVPMFLTARQGYAAGHTLTC